MSQLRACMSPCLIFEDHHEGRHVKGASLLPQVHELHAAIVQEGCLEAVKELSRIEKTLRSSLMPLGCKKQSNLLVQRVAP